MADQACAFRKPPKQQQCELLAATKSDVVRLIETKRSRGNRSALLDAVAEVIGSVDQLPHDLSARKKKYLTSTGYGNKRSR
jgi:hypothetical protein